MPLTPDEQRRVTDRVARVERATGAQVVAAVVAKSDAYPEIPWKAFALGAATAALALAAAALLGAAWPRAQGPVAHGALLLGAGAVPALLAVFCPPFARLFLDRHRSEAEVRQHAESLFRSHGVDRTHGRAGVLVLLSLFERRAVVLPDVAVRDRVGDDDLGRVVAALLPLAARREVASALVEGLAALEALLVAKGFRGGGPDEIPDALVQDASE
jgi:putative membrane protein